MGQKWESGVDLALSSVSGFSLVVKKLPVYLEIKTDYIMEGDDNMKYYRAFKEEWKHATTNDRTTWVCLCVCMLAFGASAAYSICTMWF